MHFWKKDSSVKWGMPIFQKQVSAFYQSNLFTRRTEKAKGWRTQAFLCSKNQNALQTLNDPVIIACLLLWKITQKRRVKTCQSMRFAGIPYGGRCKRSKDHGLKWKGRLCRQHCSTCSKGHRTTKARLLPGMSAVEKWKASRCSEVTDLVLSISLMLAFISGANWYFSRSMPKSIFLNSACLFVNKESTQSGGEPHHKSRASNPMRTNSACGYNQERIGPWREGIWNAAQCFQPGWNARSHSSLTIGC